MPTDLNTTRFNSSPRDLLGADEAYKKYNTILGQEKLADSLMPVARNDQIKAMASYAPEQALQVQMQENKIALAEEERLRQEQAIKDGTQLSPYANQLRILYSQSVNEINKLRSLGYDENQNEMLQAKAKSEDLRNQLSNYGLSFGTESTELGNYKTNFDEVSNKAFGLINSAVDEDGNGTIDNIGAINQGLSDLAREYNISPKNKRWASIIKSLDDMKESIAQDRRAKVQDENQEFSEKITLANLSMKKEDRRIAQDKIYKNIFTTASRLKGRPNDISYRKQALNAVLRKESGAAIADSEFNKMMENALNPSDWTKYLNELTSVQNVFLNTISDEAFNSKVLKLSDKYTARLNPGRLIEYVEGQIADDYYQLKKTGGTVPAKTTQKANTSYEFNEDDF